MNKLASEMLNYPIWILRIIFLSILIISVGFMITKYMNVRIDVSSAETAIILQRILHSPAIMHQDTITQRVYPSIPETTHWSDATTKLTEDIPYDKNNRHLGAQITLDSKQKQPVYLNKRTFEDLRAELKSFFGDDIHETKQKYTTFSSENGQLKPDTLTITVLKQT